MHDLWLLMAAAGVATYFWRALGVLLTGRVATDSDIFNWISCVAYAMVAGLIMRIVVMPGGVLASSLLIHRLLACGVALAAYRACRRNLLAGVGTGAVVLIVLNAMREY